MNAEYGTRNGKELPSRSETNGGTAGYANYAEAKGASRSVGADSQPMKGDRLRNRVGARALAVVLTLPFVCFACSAVPLNPYG